MSTAELTPRAFFSLRTDVKQNAHYITDFLILYPAGSVLILHNYYEKRQRYIKLLDKSIYLEMIVVSPSRKLAAIIENAERGQILVFDMQTLKRRRTLNLPADSTTNRFETISFSYDDTFIMAITGDPDWNLVTYKWEKGKVTSTVKASYPNSTTTVIQVCCSPTDNTEVCLIGQGLFRLLSMNETVWRQFGFQKADQINITSAAYITGERILCGSGDGKLFFIDNGDLKGVFSAFNATVINVKEKDEAAIGSSSLLLVKTMSETTDREDLSVRALIAFPKGFAYSCKTGLVHVFEKETPNKFKKRNVFRISDTSVGELQELELNVIKHLSINVSQDKLLATTSRAQLYTVRLWGPDLNVAPELPFRHLGEPLHHGPILGLTMCIWKPLFATSGKMDRTIRLWNYETESVTIVKQYTEDILSIDLHPTGNFLAIGFQQKLDISIVLMNDIQTFRSLPIQDCHKTSFNFNGTHIAAVNAGSIEIIGSILFNHVASFKGHTGTVNALCWAEDDRKLGSCGSDGCVFLWDILNGNAESQISTPGVKYWDIVISADKKFMYAVGSDGLLKEIVKTHIVRSIRLNQNYMDNLVLSRSNLMMFLTDDTAALISVKMPLTDPPEYSSFFYHAKKVNAIKLSFDDQTLVSVSDVGTVIIWKLNFAEGKTIVMDKNFIYSTEVLINKSELEKKINAIKDLSQKLYELEMGQAREMRDSENKFCESIKEIHETFTATIGELKEKVEQTEVDQHKQLVNVKKEIDNLKQRQEKEKSDLLKNYDDKLLMEYEKVRQLEALKEEMICDFEVRVKELEISKEEETNRIIEVYEKKLEEVNDSLKKALSENIENIKEHEIVKVHLEEDADREIVENKAKYEGIFKEEKELGMKLKEELVTMKKKLNEAQKARDEFRAKAEVLEMEHQKNQTNVHALEKDIVDLKAEIVDRDSAIFEKDDRILSLKNKIQELDKCKFVLEYKTTELRKQINPRDREIWERKEQISDMEFELDSLKKINSSLELQLAELKEKISGTEREVNNHEKQHLSGMNMLRQIKLDIYSLYQDVGDFKKLKDGIKALYLKYHQFDMTFKEQYGESDIQREYLVQREFLEKTIKSLKSTLKKNQQNKNDRQKVLKDNVVLLEELNSIRKELKTTLTSVRNLEKLVGVKDKKSIVPSEAFDKMQLALRKKDLIMSEYQEVINRAQEEAVDLSSKLKKMQDNMVNLLRK